MKFHLINTKNIPYQHNVFDEWQTFLRSETLHLRSEDKLDKSWDEIIELLSEPEIHIDKNAVAMICMGEFDTNPNGVRRNDGKLSRCSKNLINVTGLILDYDGGAKWEDVKEQLKEYEYFAYTSFNHNTTSQYIQSNIELFNEDKTLKKGIKIVNEDIITNERFRVIIPFDKSYDKNEMSKRRKSLEILFSGVDPTSFYLSRHFYVYSSHPNRKHNAWCYHNKGKYFNLSEIEISEIEYETIGEEIPITDKDIENVIEALKSISDSSIHYNTGGWQIINYCKSIGISKDALWKLLYSKFEVGSSLTIKSTFDNIYNTSQKGKVSITSFKSYIIKNNGSIANIKISNNRVKKLVEVEAKINERKTIKEVEKEISKGILDWIKGNRVLLKHEPGTGKTKQTIDAISNHFKKPGINVFKVDWFAYNKKNMLDVYKEFKQKGINAKIVYGREHYCKHEVFAIKTGPVTAKHYDLFRDVQMSSLCNKTCPFANECGYPKQFLNDYQVAIKHHSFLTNKSSFFDKDADRQANHLVIDEAESSDSFSITNYDYDKLPEVTKEVLKPFIEMATLGDNIFTVELSDLPDEIENIFYVKPLKDEIKSELFDNIFHPRNDKELSLFERLKIELDELRITNAAYYTNLNECVKNGIDIDSLTSFVNSQHGKRPYSYTVTKKLVEALENIHLGNNDFSFGIRGKKIIIRKRKKYKGKWRKPIILLDATADVTLLPYDYIEYKTLTNWSPLIKVTQIRDRTFSKSDIKRDDEFFVELKIFIDNNIRNCGSIGFISYKHEVIGKMLSGVDKDHYKYLIEQGKLIIDWFGNVRGSNRFEQCDKLVILGQYTENPDSLYDKTCIITNNKPSMVKNNKIKGVYKMKEGNWLQQPDGYKIYNDATMSHLAKRAEIDEMEQVIGRIRPIRVNNPKELILLTKRPHNIPIDVLVTWKSLCKPFESKRIKDAKQLIELYMSDGRSRTRQELLENLSDAFEYGERTALEVWKEIKDWMESKYEISYTHKDGIPKPLMTFAIKNSH